MLVTELEGVWGETGTAASITRLGGYKTPSVARCSGKG